MSGGEKDEGKGFVTTDRRSSASSEEEETTVERRRPAKTGAPASEPPSRTKAPQEGESEEDHQDAEGAWRDAALPEEVPPIDFNTFILSLSTSALVHIGAVPDPSSGSSDTNLPLARQSIDLLSLLEEKTKGNLTGEEERLLSQVLYDLRMRFIAALKKTQPT